MTEPLCKSCFIPCIRPFIGVGIVKQLQAIITWTCVRTELWTIYRIDNDYIKVFNSILFTLKTILIVKFLNQLKTCFVYFDRSAAAYDCHAVPGR